MRFPRLLIVSAFAATSCFSAGAGREPDLKRLYFPVGLALDASHSRLFVASSDFDLQFSGGSILALDLPRIRGLVPRECRVDADCDSGQACDTSDVSGAQASWWCLPKGKSACELWGARSIGEQLDYPGRCEGVELTAPQDGGSSLVTSAVRTSAFATELLYLSRPGGERSEGRLYAPMRGDSTLHWVEVDADGKLDCGEGDGGGCDDAHRVHARAETNNQVKLEMPVEPFAIAATPSGDALVVTHQTTNRVSLFTQDWSSSKGPRLSAIEEMAAAGPMGLGALPATQGVPDGFLLTHRSQAELDLLRVFPGSADGSVEAQVHSAGQLLLRANSVSTDSRGVLVEQVARQQCLAACSDDACSASCSDLPLEVYVASRSPSSLLIGRLAVRDGQLQLPEFQEVLSLPYGPSRVVAGEVIDASGKLIHRLFVVCFDSRRIAIVDPVSRRVETWVSTGRGPQALVVDTGVDAEGRGFALGYVAHFTDSYVGVLQLDQRAVRDYGQMVLTIAKPQKPKSER